MSTDQTINRRLAAFSRAMAGITGGAGQGVRRPLLYDATGTPMRPTAEYAYKKQAAKRSGSLENWIPRRLFTRDAEASQRQDIVARSIDLTNNAPHAAGLIDNIAVTVIGHSLVPVLNRISF